MLSKTSDRETTAWYHFCVETKGKTKDRTHRSREEKSSFQGEGKQAKAGKEHKLSVRRQTRFEDAMYNMVTIVDNTEIYT